MGDDSLKLFLDGTHRVVDPARTLARVLPLAPLFGITRLANLTGLDRLGIPVVAAYRPNSRSLAVFQGKGTTLPAAKASAVMEAVETWHAERTPSPSMRRSYVGLIAAGLQAVDPARLPRGADAQGDPREAELGWDSGRDLFSGALRWVPHDLVTADYTVGGGPVGPFQATTNGLAAGNHLLEALCHALCEVIERDAMALWRVLPERIQDSTALDLTTAPAGLRTSLLDRFAKAGVSLCAFDITSDIRVATVLCLAVDDGKSSEVLPQLGCGCHPDPAVALARAATEAAQARLTRISGARDDLVPASYDAAQTRSRVLAARDWLRSVRSRGTKRSCGSLPAFAGPTLRADLAAILERLAAVGLTEAVWIDLSRPRFDIAVVRVVVPGLEGPATAAGGGYVAGARALARGAWPA